MPTLTFKCKPFDALTVHELYAILRVRQEVFAVEQNCVYLDTDQKDQYGSHLMGFDRHSKLAAYCRLLPEGIVYPKHLSIGRVLTTTSTRGTGAGKDLMHTALRQMENIYGRKPIKISAQSHLKKFYATFGFEQCGEEYMEDGIPHIPMLKN
jgi:ElaA protein